jgi:hypothetical protein
MAVDGTARHCTSHVAMFRLPSALKRRDVPWFGLLVRRPLGFVMPVAETVTGRAIVWWDNVVVWAGSPRNVRAITWQVQKNYLVSKTSLPCLGPT